MLESLVMGNYLQAIITSGGLMAQEDNNLTKMLYLARKLQEAGAHTPSFLQKYFVIHPQNR